MTYELDILSIKTLTHNVKRFRISKPNNYIFIPGQATNVAINKPGWRDKKRAFTITSLPDDESLELIIKIYPEHNGVTKALNDLRPGNQLLLEEPWGKLTYKGPGLFIAGGTGITPFLAIFRMLEQQNKLEKIKLLYANKTSKDIIQENELSILLEERVQFILTNEDRSEYKKAYLDLDFLRHKIQNKQQYFYVCGPAEMTKHIGQYLKTMAVEEHFIILDDQ